MKAGHVKEGQTNYFQREAQSLGAPRKATSIRSVKDGKHVITISWQTAYAANDPIQHYDVFRDDNEIGKVNHIPQITTEGFQYQDNLAAHDNHVYRVVAIDRSGKSASSDPFRIRSST